MTIKKLSLLGLMSACLIAETSHASVLGKMMPTFAAAGGIWLASKKLTTIIDNSDELYKPSNLPEKYKNRIEKIYKEHGMGHVQILEEKNPVAHKSDLPIGLSRNRLIIPQTSFISLTKGEDHTTYFTPEEIEASIHLTCEMSSAIGHKTLIMGTSIGLITGRAAQLKNPKLAVPGFFGGWITVKAINWMLPYYILFNNFNINNSKTAFDAARAFEKDNMHNTANVLKKTGEELRGQGK